MASHGRLSPLAALGWALLYLLTFLLRAGRRAADDTVDLTRGKLPEVHALGYAIRTHRFTRHETARIADASRAAGRTVTETVCEAIAQGLFALQPEKRRLLVSLPVDLSAEAGAADGAPGNFTGSLLVQLFRDRPLAPQIHAAFRGFRRGVPFGVARIVAATAKNERALRDRFAAQARLAIPARAPFENFSCAVSSLGVLRHAALDEHVAQISAHGMTQTIFFGVLTLDGQLTIEAAAANDLFEAREVERAFERVTHALAREPRGSEGEVRESGTRRAAAGVG